MKYNFINFLQYSSSNKHWYILVCRVYTYELCYEFICMEYGSRNSSVGLATGYGSAKFVSSPQRPDKDVKLTTHLHLVPRSRIMELYLHFSKCLHGVVFN
jgi:hypothetical protein